MKKNVEVKVGMKARAQQAFYAAKGWCVENKEVIVALAPTMIAGSIELIKIAAKKGYVAEEKRLKDLYIYDRQYGHYYELARKPTNKEWLMFDERRRISYKSVGDILKDMKLLK